MTDIKSIIDNNSEAIRNAVSEKLSHLTSGTEDYITAWKALQDEAAEVVVDILKPLLPNCEFYIPKGKSTYPDIKITAPNGDLYAIDVKCNEASKDPWFDMARLDTIYKERINKYVYEWELIIKYDSEDNGKFLKAYFLKFREVVGMRPDCKGIKYRPYDGKVRPKTWSDFDNEIVYWKTDDDFHKGIDISLIYRWKENIKSTLVPKLTDEQKKEFKALFD